MSWSCDGCAAHTQFLSLAMPSSLCQLLLQAHTSEHPAVDDLVLGKVVASNVEQWKVPPCRVHSSSSTLCRRPARSSSPAWLERSSEAPMHWSWGRGSAMTSSGLLSSSNNVCFCSWDLACWHCRCLQIGISCKSRLSCQRRHLSSAFDEKQKTAR